jgi:phosphoglycerate dehydrogenase-like enzyme
MDFVKYLEEKNAQKKLEKLAKKYSGKKIILYGAGHFAETVLKNYDVSKLNIIAFSDIKYASKKEFLGYKVLDPYTLKDTDFDVLLIATYKDLDTLDFFEDNLFKNFKPKFKVDTLIRMSFWEYIKGF